MRLVPWCLMVSVLIDLGLAADAVFSSANGLLVAGDFVMLGVNTFINDGLMGVNGNLILDVSMESEETTFIEQQEMLVSGDMFVYGGGSREQILFDPSVASTIQGNLYVDVAGNLAPGVQLLRLEPNTTIGGNVTMLSTSESEHRRVPQRTWCGDRGQYGGRSGRR